jgi:hypothetical protein
LWFIWSQMREDVVCLHCSNCNVASDIYIKSAAQSRSEPIIDSDNILRVSRIARGSNVMRGGYAPKTVFVKKVIRCLRQVNCGPQRSW